jgi:hypothetical protein
MKKIKPTKNIRKPKMLPALLTNVRNCSDAINFPYDDGALVTYLFFTNRTYSFLAPTSKANKSTIREAIQFSAKNGLDVLAIWKGQWRTDAFIVDEPQLAIDALK